MEELVTRDLTNPYKGIKLTPYRMIAAGQGAGNITLPDGSEITCDQVKRDLDFCQLCSWNSEGSALLRWVEYLKEHPESKCDLVVDSGAYSAWSKGKEFDIDKYINFLNSNNVIDVAFWVAEADVIPGAMGREITEEDRRIAPEKSWENYLYMIKRVKYPKKVIPIFHRGEDFKHLIRMLEYKMEDGEFIPYIGIAFRNDGAIDEKLRWIESVWKVIYEKCEELGRDIPLTHNFGMTMLPLIEQYPSCSSDSTTWSRTAGFGSINLVINGKIKTLYVSKRNINSSDHINNQSAAVREAVENICHRIGHGITLNDLIEDPNGNLRKLFNLYSLHEWKQNFEYKGTSLFKESLW